MHNPTSLITPKWEDYELIDSGNGKKLERFSRYTFIRPDSQAIWKPSQENWQTTAINSKFEMHFDAIKVWAQTTTFGHLGVFPESTVYWKTLVNKLVANSQPRVLNLFGYTGLTTCFLASLGAKVTHVDASKKSVAWAKENQMLSGLSTKPIRWIVDDVLKFVDREIKRGEKYDAIILDPPKFGRGPGGEIWKIAESLYPLLTKCNNLLSDKPLFLLLTVYATDFSSLSLNNCLSQIFSGNIEFGEIGTRQISNGFLLPQAIFGSCTYT